MSRIDDFFNKQLSDYRESDDQWNIPDEKLWNNAKEHFPKEKKKRRFLFWLFPAIALVLAYSYFFGLPRGLTNKDSVEYLLAEDHSASLNSNFVSDGSHKAPIETILQSANIKPLAADRTNTDQVHKTTNHISLSEPQGTKNETIIKPTTHRTHASSRSTYNAQSNQDLKQNVGPRRSTNALTTDNITQIDQIAEKYNDKPNINEPSSLDGLSNDVSIKPSLVTDLAALTPLSLIEINDLITDANAIEDIEHKMILNQNIKNTTPSIEFGVSHLYFPIQLLNGTNLSDEEGDRIMLQTKFRNVNVTIRKWLNPKWSVQTGLFTTQLNGTIDFSVKFPATQEDIEVITNAEYQEVNNQANSTNNAQIEFDLIDAPEIRLNDEIAFDGLVSVNLNALQVPLFAHRHWYKKRFEFIAGGGLTLEYLWGSQQGESFQLALNGQNIMGQIRQNQYVAKYYDTSIYMEAGMKYKLSPQINIGLSVRANMLEPIFSGFDIGINYRLY